MSRPSKTEEAIREEYRKKYADMEKDYKDNIAALAKSLHEARETIRDQERKIDILSTALLAKSKECDGYIENVS